MSPDDVILESLSRARAVLDSGVDPKSLRWLLGRADAELKKRLLHLTGKQGHVRFTDARALQYRHQIRLVTAYVQGRVKGLTHELAAKAVVKSLASTGKTLAALDKAYSGVVVPLSIQQATKLSAMQQHVSSSLLQRHATSVDRYGQSLLIEYETLMARGMLTGVSQHQMINALCGSGGPKGMVSIAATEIAGKVVRLREEMLPEGLFARRRYWAERIVRTEVAHAANAANYTAIVAARNDDFPDLKKKILATFDLRTAMDSVAVHGQVRAVEEPFIDGAGRNYLYPPARPNDRETVIPWRDHWEPTALTEPADQKGAAELMAAPSIAQGADPKLAVQDAKEALDGHHRVASVYDGVLTAAKAAASRISAQAAAKAVEQKATVSYLGAKAKAEASIAAAKAKIAAVTSQDVIDAAHAHQMATTIEGKKQAATEHKLAQAQLKVQQYQAEQRAQKKLELEKKLAPIRKAVETLTQADNHAMALQVLKNLAKQEPALFGHLYRAHVLDGGELAPKFFAGLVKAPGAKVKSLAKAMGVELPKPKLAAPAEPAWAKPYEKPKPLAGIEIKEVSGFQDIHDVATGKKLAYLKQVEGQWVVDPPELLKAKGWDKLTWQATDEHKSTAADYAVQVSKAIQANAGEIAAAKAKAAAEQAALAHAAREAEQSSRAKFNPREVPETLLGPLKLHATTARYVEEARAAIRQVKAHELRQERGRCVVDTNLHAHGLETAQEKWSSHWYGSSKGARNTLGLAISKDLTKAELKAIAIDVGWTGEPEKLVDMARRKYAATQAALEARDAQHGGQREWMFLSRGIQGSQGTYAKAKRVEAETVPMALHPLSSWSSKRAVADRFSDGVIMRAAVHRSRVFSQFEQEATAMRSFGDRESEYILISTVKTEKFKARDLENDGGDVHWNSDTEHAVSANHPVYKIWLKPDK